jgi:hypothetical protein
MYETAVQISEMAKVDFQDRPSTPRRRIRSARKLQIKKPTVWSTSA